MGGRRHAIAGGDGREQLHATAGGVDGPTKDGDEGANNSGGIDKRWRLGGSSMGGGVTGGMQQKVEAGRVMAAARGLEGTPKGGDGRGNNRGGINKRWWWWRRREAAGEETGGMTQQKVEASTGGATPTGVHVEEPAAAAASTTTTTFCWFLRSCCRLRYHLLLVLPLLLMLLPPRLHLLLHATC